MPKKHVFAMAVPPHCNEVPNYITVFTHYRVLSDDDGTGRFLIHVPEARTSRFDEPLVCLWEACAHLSGGNWTRIEYTDDELPEELR